MDARALAGQVALVTGGGSGIGRATASGLAELGANVMVFGRRADALDGSQALHDNIRGVVGDVTSPADVDRAVTGALATFGRLDILVNNAGIVVATPLDTLDEEDARLMWRTHVVGPTLFAQAALPHLTQIGGVIINVSGSLAHRSAPGMSHYGASKAALEQLTRSWALELADRGVRVNAVAPGQSTAEPWNAPGHPQGTGGNRERQQRDCPPGRYGGPGEVAHWIIELADPAVGWVTGQIVNIDAGVGLVQTLADTTPRESPVVSP